MCTSKEASKEGNNELAHMLVLKCVEDHQVLDIISHDVTSEVFGHKSHANDTTDEEI